MTEPQKAEEPRRGGDLGRQLNEQRVRRWAGRGRR